MANAQAAPAVINPAPRAVLSALGSKPRNSKANQGCRSDFFFKMMLEYMRETGDPRGFEYYGVLVTIY